MNVTTASSLRSAFETSLAGFQKAEKKMNRAAAQIADGDIEPAQVVGLSEAAIEAKANVLTVRSSEETYGALLKALA